MRALLEVTRPAHGAIPDGMPWWLAWSIDPWFLIPVGLISWWYARGLARWETRSREHPWSRTALFCGGMTLLVLTMESPIDRLGVHEFSMHMIQHETLMMLAIPLILLGAPTTPLLKGMPRWLRRGVVRPIAGGGWGRFVYRLLTHPIIDVATFSLTLWLWHFGPGWYNATMTNQGLHDLEHFTMTAAATLFWWNVIDPKPLHSRLNMPLRVLYLFAGSVPKQFLGAFLTFVTVPTYPYYESVRRIFASSALQDQTLAGLIMWVPGGMAMLIEMGIVFFVWAHRSEVAGRAEGEAFAEAYHREQAERAEPAAAVHPER